ncbi:uncharacterized [Tachysurus ichikawai]
MKAKWAKEGMMRKEKASIGKIAKRRQAKAVKHTCSTKSVALALSYDSNTHQIKSAEVFTTAMWPTNTTKRT